MKYILQYMNKCIYRVTSPQSYCGENCENCGGNMRYCKHQHCFSGSVSYFLCWLNASHLTIESQTILLYVFHNAPWDSLVDQRFQVLFTHFAIPSVSHQIRPKFLVFDRQILTCEVRDEEECH